MQERQPCVYPLASCRNGVLYAGVTSNFLARIWQHRNDVVEGFTQRHHVHSLVWLEMRDTMETAIAREQAVKAWRRAWTIELMEKSNPYWRDLCAEICQ